MHDVPSYPAGGRRLLVAPQPQAAVRQCEADGDSWERPPEVRAAWRGQRVSSDSRQSLRPVDDVHTTHVRGPYRDVSATDELDIANCYHAVHVAVITLSQKYVSHCGCHLH